MQETVQKLKVLFLCTGNSCRSQMAEGWARHLKGDVIEPIRRASRRTGSIPTPSRSWPKPASTSPAIAPNTWTKSKDIPFDYVVTVCDHAHESCPLFPGRTKVIHVGFDDPPQTGPDRQERARGARTIIDECEMRSGDSSNRCRTV